MPVDEAKHSMRVGPVDRLWVLIVAGIPTGVIVAGVGSRLAMLLLRLTSPEGVHGLVSDDGFVIGRVTLAGTYNLLLIGAVVGVLGAAAYTWVAPWLLGPLWFRRLTTAIGSGVVVGSLLVHSDGVDFTVLEPHWLAVTLFVLLPALFGWVIGAAVDRARLVVARTHGLRRYAIPVVLVVAFPPTALILVPAAAIVVMWSWATRGAPADDSLSVPVGIGIVVRAGWLGVAALGLVELAGDVVDIV